MTATAAAPESVNDWIQASLPMQPLVILAGLQVETPVGGVYASPKYPLEFKSTGFGREPQSRKWMRNEAELDYDPSRSFNHSDAFAFAQRLAKDLPVAMEDVDLGSDL
jgi:hypothetical protein